VKLRRLLPALTAAAAAALVVPLVQAPATAAPPAPALYLALGDSVPAGFGVPQGQGYVELLGSRLSDDRACGKGPAPGCRLTAENAAVSGARIGYDRAFDLLAGQVPHAETVLRARNGNATAVDDVRLLTVTIGGNDVVNPIIQACAGGLNATCVARINERFEYLGDRYDEALSRLRSAAGPRTTIAVMGYYNGLVAPCPAAAIPGMSVLAPLVLEGGVPGVSTSLNGVIRDAAAVHGAVYVPTVDVVGPGELLGDCLHPNVEGHQVIAERFQDLLANKVPTPVGRR
jgi:lysophospholipase L1-like esterase